MEQFGEKPSNKKINKRIELILGSGLSLMSLLTLADKELRPIHICALITLLLGLGITANVVYNKEDGS